MLRGGSEAVTVTLAVAGRRTRAVVAGRCARAVIGAGAALGAITLRFSGICAAEIS